MQSRQDVVLFAHSLVSPFDGDVVVAGVGLYPTLVIVGAPAEDFFVYYRDAENLAEEVEHLLGSGQAAEIAMNDDRVKAMVYKDDQAVEELCE